MEIFIPKYQDYHSINISSQEVPRVSWWHKVKCWQYRLKLERSHEYGKKPIDNIDVGYLLVWKNPIQLGVDLLNPGGEIYIPAGTYTQTDTTITGVSNLVLRGSGYATEIKMAKTAGTTQKLIQIDGKDNVEICNIFFNGDGATINAAGYGSEHDHAIAFINGCTYGRVHHCRIIDMCGDGISVSGDGSNFIFANNEIKITNQATSPTVGRNCIAVIQGARIIIENNILESFGVNPEDFGKYKM